MPPAREKSCISVRIVTAFSVSRLARLVGPLVGTGSGLVTFCISEQLTARKGVLDV
jgi:hypothetical protein